MWLLVASNLNMAADAGRWSLTLLTMIHLSQSNQEDDSMCMNYIAWCRLYLL